MDAASSLGDGADGGHLSVVTGLAEASIGLKRQGQAPDAANAAAEQARLERELADAERLLVAARARLANAAFLEKAPPAVVDGARASEAELLATVARLRGRLGR